MVDRSPAGEAHNDRHLDRTGRPWQEAQLWHGHPIVTAGELTFVPWGIGPVREGEEERAPAWGPASGRHVTTRPASVAG